MFPKKTELATSLRDQRADERLRAFIRNSSEAVYCIEMEEPFSINLPVGQIIDLLYQHAYLSEVNESYAKSAGLKVDEMVGLRLGDFLPRSIPENHEFLEKSIAARFDVTDLETTEVFDNGTKGIYLNNLTPVLEDGLLYRLWGTAQNISEKKRLETELQTSEKDLQKLAGRLIYKQENELRRLARDLHDNLTQQLAVLAIEAGGLENQPGLAEPVQTEISHIKNQLVHISEDVHKLSRDLHPSIIEDLGLEEAVKSECTNFSSRMGLPVILSIKDIPTSVPADIALALYRIIQEGLNNASKHAKCKNIYVFLEGVDGDISLMIRDTGIGFSVEKVTKKPGLGLSSIRERVRLVGGQFSIKTKAGKGTSVEVRIPLTSKNKE
jgi:signal transduction histidine kinase